MIDDTLESYTYLNTQLINKLFLRRVVIETSDYVPL